MAVLLLLFFILDLSKYCYSFVQKVDLMQFYGCFEVARDVGINIEDFKSIAILISTPLSLYKSSSLNVFVVGPI